MDSKNERESLAGPCLEVLASVRRLGGEHQGSQGSLLGIWAAGGPHGQEGGGKAACQALGRGLWPPHLMSHLVIM